MLTWLRTRPAGTRRAARPATLLNEATKKRPTPPPVEEDMPPPFFADDDAAFLDMGDSPVVSDQLSVVSKAADQPGTPPIIVGKTSGSRLAQAVLDLPPFPERHAENRMGKLLDIFRSLDRIAGAACDDSAPAPNNR